ncbi:MAG TPA: substrate-binding domain-containing protein [Polyangiaceae bacterium]|jgi:LacI family transcriptional regulator
MTGPHVLVVLGTSAAWSRGILRGFTAVAHEHGWNLLHYHPSANLEWLAREWTPSAAVLGPEVLGPWPAVLGSRVNVSVNVDRVAEGVASVCLDEERIAERALAHLVSKGLRNVTAFRFGDWSFAVARERHFAEKAVAAGVRFVEGWWAGTADPPRSEENPAAIAAWIRGLPKPCGVFACSDAFARVVARYARATGLRVPEDVAIVGVDNDAIECELTAPPLSSVAIPWRSVGQNAAWLVRSALGGDEIAGRRVMVSPADVVTRRSSDAMAIGDAMVGSAVRWIHQHADTRITVPEVARAVGTTRQRLERRFRSVLGRTVLHEIRAAHVEAARRLLATTGLGLSQIAAQSGFTNAALLNVAFRRLVGEPPGAYRRHVRGASGDED